MRPAIESSGKAAFQTLHHCKSSHRSIGSTVDSIVGLVSKALDYGIDTTITRQKALTTSVVESVTSAKVPKGKSNRRNPVGSNRLEKTGRETRPIMIPTVDESNI